MSAHRIVFANEKGGTGKSTTAVHVAIALAYQGARVAAIDLDPRQRTLHRYLENRAETERRRDIALPGVTFAVFNGDSVEALEELALQIGDGQDFLLFDTPGRDDPFARHAATTADTLVTPLNDSFVDFDVLGTIDPVNFAVTGASHYAQMVGESRKQRRLLDGATSDWIVIRNRLSVTGSRNKQLVSDCLSQLSLKLGFRAIDGLAERVVYRELFPRGLTALDDLDEATLGMRPNLAHVTAREEVANVLRQLKLPLDERGRRRAAARAEWFAQVDKPLDMHDIFGSG